MKGQAWHVNRIEFRQSLPCFKPNGQRPALPEGQFACPSPSGLFGSQAQRTVQHRRRIRPLALQHQRPSPPIPSLTIQIAFVGQRGKPLDAFFPQSRIVQQGCSILHLKLPVRSIQAEPFSKPSVCQLPILLLEGGQRFRFQGLRGHVRLGQGNLA